MTQATMAEAATSMPEKIRQRAVRLGLLPETEEAPEVEVETLRAGRLEDKPEPEVEAEPAEEKEQAGAFYRGDDGRYYVKGGGCFVISKARGNKEDAAPQAGIKSMRPYIKAGLYVTVLDSEGNAVKRYAPSK